MIRVRCQTAPVLEVGTGVYPRRTKTSHSSWGPSFRPGLSLRSGNISPCEPVTALWSKACFSLDIRLLVRAGAIRDYVHIDGEMKSPPDAPLSP